MTAAACHSSPRHTTSLNSLDLLAQNLRRLRLALNLSQQDLNRQLKWPAGRIGMIEARVQPDLTLDEIDQIAQALDIEPYALFAA